jgi:hypothetical protein
MIFWKYKEQPIKKIKLFLNYQGYLQENIKMT